LKNLGLKLVSLFLAFVVWFMVSAPRRERPVERKFAAPLSLVGMRREYVITTPVPETVSVRLRGRRSDLRNVSSQLLEVPVDLAWVTRAGTATITLYPQALNVPDEIEVLSIEPNKIQFTVEKLSQSAVTIRPFIYGEAAPGHMADTPVVEPVQALVSGPASQIRSLEEVSTERINISGRTATFTQRVQVLSDSQLVRVVEPLTAQVTVPILAPVGPSAPPPAAQTETTETTSTTTDTTGTP
jgi:YbbR domain-containing protein